MACGCKGRGISTNVTRTPLNVKLYIRFLCLLFSTSQSTSAVQRFSARRKLELYLRTKIYDSYLHTPQCRVLLDKLTGLQLAKKFHTFHGTRKFITALTSVRQLSLSWTSPIQSIYPHPTSWRSILILSTHLRLGLPSGLFPSGFPSKTLYTPLSSPICATCPAHLILLDFKDLRLYSFLRRGHLWYRTKLS